MKQRQANLFQNLKNFLKKINYKMLPTRTLANQNKIVKGMNRLEDRLTIATCSNA